MSATPMPSPQLFAPKLADYATLVFDCDGVVLDSNRVKTEAFYQTALPYGEDVAIALRTYHQQHGGVSRYRKWEYFLRELLPVEAAGRPSLEQLLTDYAAMVRQGLAHCAIAPALLELRRQTAQQGWMIVSGGDQEELREIFAERTLSPYFDRGIYGSPDTKEVILHREIDRGNIQLPALFLGDSRYDHQAATTAGLDFLFLSEWSEFMDWPLYQAENGFPVYPNLKALLESAS